jgi:hypothetical protein
MTNSTIVSYTTGRALVAAGDGDVEIRSVSVERITEWDIQVQLERSAISIGTESHVVRKIASAESPVIVGYAPVARPCGQRGFPNQQLTDSRLFFAESGVGSRVDVGQQARVFPRLSIATLQRRRQMPRSRLAKGRPVQPWPECP